MQLTVFVRSGVSPPMAANGQRAEKRRRAGIEARVPLTPEEQQTLARRLQESALGISLSSSAAAV